jgi:hypothetical protein
MKRSLAALSFASVVWMGGCDQGTTPAGKGAAGVMEKAKDTATKTVDGAKDAAAKGAEAAKDAAAKGGEMAKDAAAKAGDAAKGAMDAIKAEGGKWLTETVEKQWPAAKASLEDLTKKAADIKDAGLKTKVTEAVKSLTGQTTEIEGLVGQLKNFKEGDYGAMFTKAKGLWDGFNAKLTEVKGMMPK